MATEIEPSVQVLFCVVSVVRPKKFEPTCMKLKHCPDKELDGELDLPFFVELLRVFLDKQPLFYCRSVDG